MNERWVVNASPLIVLAQIQCEHLLVDLPGEIVVPQTVVNEINAGPANDAARKYLSHAPLRVVAVLPEAIVQGWDLGGEETAVLSFAQQNRGWRAVVDDGAARRCAHVLGVPVIGTLGVILRARKANLIPAAAPLLRKLKDEGFRLDDEIIRAALSGTVGEEWA
ncbi:DUF3368 domain-containing protein [bacterium]|nr:DUF3368 domain-containing protein [bacterium]